MVSHSKSQLQGEPGLVGSSAEVHVRRQVACSAAAQGRPGAGARVDDQRVRGSSEFQVENNV